MSVLRALGEVFAHAPPLLLASGALLLALAWYLRRRYAGPGRQRGALGLRLACVLFALALLGLAVRRGAIGAARARRTRTLHQAIDRGEATAREHARQALAAWAEAACETPGHDPHGCALTAAALLVNPACDDGCIAALRKRPDVLALAEAMISGDVGPAEADADAGAADAGASDAGAGAAASP
ncbi:MAG: hypothetical protein IT370_05225 [Deltaproteobacteria bacterium]|nr:hypothetical protein [Deltaproteobacteria bacterium]